MGRLMTIKQQDQEFINEMVEVLDESIRRLTAQEQYLLTRIGADRVAELREYWQKQLAATDEEAFRLAMDHDDKKLTWIWLRLKSVHASRAKAGQTLMKNHTLN